MVFPSLQISFIYNIFGLNLPSNWRWHYSHKQPDGQIFSVICLMPVKPVAEPGTWMWDSKPFCFALLTEVT